MKHAELLVQLLHFLAMRRRIITLFTISCLLMLSQTHDPCRFWPNIHPVGQRGDEHGANKPRTSNVRSRLQLRSGREIWNYGANAGWVGQEHGDRRKGLERKVHWKGVALKGRELGPRQHTEGDDTGDEALE